PEPSALPELVRYARTIAVRAAATARVHPAGPVHLNCPYREPLQPAWLEMSPAAAAGPLAVVATGRRTLASGQIRALAGELGAAMRGLIVCGPQDDPALPQTLVPLAQALGYPILADPLSGLRTGEHDRSLVLDCYDAFLRDTDLAERLGPEIVLRFGAMPTSKQLLLFLQKHAGCRQLLIDGGAGWSDPAQLTTQVLHADAREFCLALGSALECAPRASAWHTLWQQADRLARRAIVDRFAKMDALFDGKVFAELSALLPAGAVLYVGNS